MTLISHYKIPPRQVFRFFDRLRTSIALSGGSELLMPLLLEMIAIEISGGNPRSGRPWAFYLPGYVNNGEWMAGDAFYDGCVDILHQNERLRNKDLNKETTLNAILADFVHRQQGVKAHEYGDLLNRVGNFSSS